MGIGHRIDWRGSQAQEAVIQAYREADLFVLASKVADDGDRDGLPNVLMEAQSQALACLATNAAGIPELIRDGVTGKLVPPGDADALAAGLKDLIVSPATRERLGTAGAAEMQKRFSFESGIDRLAGLFGLSLSPATARAAE